MSPAQRRADEKARWPALSAEASGVIATAAARGGSVGASASVKRCAKDATAVRSPGKGLAAIRLRPRWAIPGGLGRAARSEPRQAQKDSTAVPFGRECRFRIGVDSRRARRPEWGGQWTTSARREAERKAMTASTASRTDARRSRCRSARFDERKRPLALSPVAKGEPAQARARHEGAPKGHVRARLPRQQGVKESSAAGEAGAKRPRRDCCGGAGVRQQRRCRCRKSAQEELGWT